MLQSLTGICVSCFLPKTKDKRQIWRETLILLDRTEVSWIIRFKLKHYTEVYFLNELFVFTCQINNLACQI